MQDKADIILGYAAAGVGTTGAAFQLWDQVGSALVIGLNVTLAIGGIYLLRLRIKRAHQDQAWAKAAIDRHERDQRKHNDPPEKL